MCLREKEYCGIVRGTIEVKERSRQRGADLVAAAHVCWPGLAARWPPTQRRLLKMKAYLSSGEEKEN